ncbi:hypothetical protein NKH18_51070 [Streptomyces sp. M10(2022)]
MFSFSSTSTASSSTVLPSRPAKPCRGPPGLVPARREHPGTGAPDFQERRGHRLVVLAETAMHEGSAGRPGEHDRVVPADALRAPARCPEVDERGARLAAPGDLQALDARLADGCLRRWVVLTLHTQRALAVTGAGKPDWGCCRPWPTGLRRTVPMTAPTLPGAFAAQAATPPAAARRLGR